MRRAYHKVRFEPTPVAMCAACLAEQKQLCPLHAHAQELLEALKTLLPMAEMLHEVPPTRVILAKQAIQHATEGTG